MMDSIILASKSGVRKKILEENKIRCIVEPSNIDEDSVKQSLLKEKATPEIISKNLAELKANKISQKISEKLVFLTSAYNFITVLAQLIVFSDFTIFSFSRNS